MDVEDIDSISFKFRQSQINDKEHLVSEFRRLCANTHLSDEICSFYLDMAEWNLNTALWAYYEYAASSLSSSSNSSSGTNYLTLNDEETSVTQLPQMKFLCDITIGEGESVAPGTNFVKTWRILNSGKLKCELFFLLEQKQFLFSCKKS